MFLAKSKQDTLEDKNNSKVKAKLLEWLILILYLTTG